MSLVWHYLEYNLKNEDGTQFGGDRREGEMLAARSLDDDIVARGFNTLDAYMRDRQDNDATRERRRPYRARQYRNRPSQQQQAEAARQRHRMEERIRREQEENSHRRRRTTMTGRPAGRANTSNQMRPTVNPRSVAIQRSMIERRKKELLEYAARQHFNNNPIRMLDQQANLQWINMRRQLEERAFREVTQQFNIGDNPR